MLFGSLEDIDRRGPYTSKMGTLEKYPGDISVADLRGVAHEVSETVARVEGQMK